MRVVTTYDRITRTVHKSLPCPTCGKQVRRQRTFGQTVNPFNKNPDGTVKTTTEVTASVVEMAQAWKAEPEPCKDH